MTNGNDVTDLKIAQLFLDTLDTNGKFTFQTFDDNQDRKDSRLARTFSGTLEEHAAVLSELQQKGAGVFVTANETDLAGRKKENIKRVRAIFADLDGSPIEPVLEHPCEPHLVIESSKGRYHAYWLCHDVNFEEFTHLQKQLARTFESDPSVHNLPRVMRCPGFFHQREKTASQMGHS